MNWDSERNTEQFKVYLYEYISFVMVTLNHAIASTRKNDVKRKVKFMCNNKKKKNLFITLFYLIIFVNGITLIGPLPVFTLDHFHFFSTIWWLVWLFWYLVSNYWNVGTRIQKFIDLIQSLFFFFTTFIILWLIILSGMYFKNTILPDSYNIYI